MPMLSTHRGEWGMRPSRSPPNQRSISKTAYAYPSLAIKRCSRRRANGAGGAALCCAPIIMSMQLCVQMRHDDICSSVQHVPILAVRRRFGVGPDGAETGIGQQPHLDLLVQAVQCLAVIDLNAADLAGGAHMRAGVEIQRDALDLNHAN